MSNYTEGQRPKLPPSGKKGEDWHCAFYTACAAAPSAQLI